MDKHTILITGATGNIGGGAALALAHRGAKVVLLGREIKTLEARSMHIRDSLLKAQINYQREDIATLVIDFADMDSVKRAAAEALNRFPSIDGLVLSVGRLAQDGPNILPNGHERMFAASVLGPFLFTQLLLKRMEQSKGLILQVIAPFYEEMDWDDLESIGKHKAVIAYNRAKTCERMIVGELARRYAGKISSVAFNPSFIIDKSDPELKKRWPTGLTGVFWSILATLIAKPPHIAGEPIADLMLSTRNNDAINGALFKLNRRMRRPDKAMNDVESGSRLWERLVQLTESGRNCDCSSGGIKGN